MPRSANWSTTRHRLPPLQAALESARATITLTNGSRLPRGLTGAIDFAATLAVAGLAVVAFAEVLDAGFFAGAGAAFFAIFVALGIAVADLPVVTAFVVTGALAV